LSQYIATENEDESDQIASNLGWNEFCDWARTLSLDDYFEVRHLADHAWERDLADLREQLQRAVTESPPVSTVKTVAEGIITFLDVHEDAEIITVGDGLVDEDLDTGDGEDDDDEYDEAE
jgi:hypothetical protein